MCSKKQYTTYRHASHDAKEIRNKYDGTTDVYQCHECGRWHVGTNLFPPPKKVYKREPKPNKHSIFS